ncbi:hypothetical protein KZZ52_29555 [Dactylosporangium sp. AC04546]|nr:hypothetical protein [Dactylosporangium sp. AC04546]WVK78145.1 hypothetical protein KZZ52_29555 [Dactylosporangium sp. AC04546]
MKVALLTCAFLGLLDGSILTKQLGGSVGLAATQAAKPVDTAPAR